MNHLTNLYKHKCEQLQEQINHLNKLLLEVNAEHSGTGGTPPPTVIRFGVTPDGYDIPDDMRAPDMNNEHPLFNEKEIQEILDRQRREMEDMGASDAEIEEMMRYLRQLIIEYLTGGHGQASDQYDRPGSRQSIISNIRGKLIKNYQRIRDGSQWYHDYGKRYDRRVRVNGVITDLNDFGRRYITPYGPHGWGVPYYPPFPTIPYVQ
jgi:hypothetical protein